MWNERWPTILAVKVGEAYLSLRQSPGHQIYRAECLRKSAPSTTATFPTVCVCVKTAVITRERHWSCTIWNILWQYAQFIFVFSWVFFIFSWHFCFLLLYNILYIIFDYCTRHGVQCHNHFIHTAGTLRPRYIRDRYNTISDTTRFFLGPQIIFKTYLWGLSDLRNSSIFTHIIAFQPKYSV